ncbi:hypothetical protein [uncultured Selenomonas sp.]|uniref:hypothetical protein n=1 Tax=uncultured Selenomonas sp. TaxID=159275 RepID=UPI0025D1D48D|nr:hypothetical protein [uncultured Selenomonas sp.]MDD6699324.1 hypothetical protein [Veillonellaceae bacterium]
MTFLSQEDAVTAITAKAALLHKEIAEKYGDMMRTYAEKFVLDVLDYCHRDDFPQALVYTAVELIGKWASLETDGAAGPLKSIQMDDTQFTFAVSDVSGAGTLADQDFDSIRPKLNLYRKLVRPDGF